MCTLVISAYFSFHVYIPTHKLKSHALCWDSPQTCSKDNHGKLKDKNPFWSDRMSVCVGRLPIMKDDI